eukprot:TRINITY_DN25422_c0_g1_i3.p1 TRINITY_DN25422_c0_g1~~TRINITY_DN25422_c0_g1_i3.p1  ORF type:complete len:437 (+),score=83.65 TRINITY_DN25422_c0_g1_i3:69-1313(+)
MAVAPAAPAEAMAEPVDVALRPPNGDGGDDVDGRGGIDSKTVTEVCPVHPAVDPVAASLPQVTSAPASVNPPMEAGARPMKRSWYGDMSVSEKLREIYDAQEATTEFDALCDQAMEALQKICTTALDVKEFHIAPFDWSPDVHLERFGSTVQGTALQSSDLDIRMSFEQFSVHESSRQLRYLRAIADQVEKEDRFAVVSMIEGARVPVLRLRFNDQGGAQLDIAIRDLLEAAADKGALRFVRLVKAFAKTHRLVDAHGGLLNSLSWVLVAINFLQLQRSIPTLEEVMDGEVDRSTLWPVRLTASQFQRFFGFVEKFQEGSFSVGIWWGTIKKRGFWSWSGGAAPSLVIDNPCANGANISACFQRTGLRDTVKRCEAARAGMMAATQATDQEEAVWLLEKIFGKECRAAKRARRF